MRIAVDFDNVLYDYDGKWRGGTLTLSPVPGAVEAMQELAANHHTLIVFSTRGWLKAHRLRMSEWLDEHGIPYSEIARTKPNADIYIDDKAFHFRNWPDTLRELSANIPESYCELAVFGLRQTDNAGRILRNADAFECSRVHFVACCPEIRGMTGNVPYCFWDSVDEFLQSNNLPTVALHTRPTLPKLTALPSRMLLVVGGETNGLPSEIVQRCDWKYHIPQTGNYSCLTADTAAAIALSRWYEQWRV